MRKLIISSVRDSIQHQIWSSPGSELLQHLLSRGARISVFAGGVRDTILAEECGLPQVRPRDWDIGISHISREEFEGILNEQGGTKNRYGGYKLFSKTSQSWELWRQEDTVGLKKTKSPFSIENVLRSFVLSCNAIAFDIDKGHICDHGALRSIVLCELTILEDAIMHDCALFAAKALTLAFRRPLKLSTVSENFVRKNLEIQNLVHEFGKAYSIAPISDGPEADRQKICRTSI
jgi:hypothetical protein